MISGLQHPNLVRLFGCCIEREQLLLVYEYMENNSLARALFSKLMFYSYNAFYVHNRKMRRKCFWWILLIGFWTSILGPIGGCLKLDWLARQKICASIARSSALLHEESILKIVHRDIKSANILLDGDFNPKIFDFGLGKLYEEENTHISTRISGTMWATFLSFFFFVSSPLQILIKSSCE